MAQQQTRSAKELPAWAIWLGSLVIGVHFLAVGTLVLSAANGPWAVRLDERVMESTASGPKFAETLSDVFTPWYLEPLRLTHNYHYTPERMPKVQTWDAGNRLLISSVYFEARLKDARGTLLRTIKFPGDTSNVWLRHRYKLLALGLGNDQPVQVNRAEVIPGPGKKMGKVTFWDSSDQNLWKLTSEDEHLVPKDRPVMQPSEWSLLLAHSYQRYLLRKYDDAASVELIRHSKDPVLPDFMYLPNLPPNTFNELVCSFGEYRREN
jgi:hypothetical protein